MTDFTKENMSEVLLFDCYEVSISRLNLFYITALNHTFSQRIG